MAPHASSRPCPWTAFAALAVACLASSVSAQSAPAANHDQDPALIRVYANLLQIPVLILDPFRKAVKPIDPAKFTIQFDDGKPLRPRMVRLEGADPITLAVLVDTSHPSALLPRLSDALGSLAPGQLGPTDRIVIYGMDGCKLLRFGNMLPVQRGVLEAYTRAAAQTPPVDRSAVSCPEPMTLWKSIAVVANTLNGEPGRRILLAITNGVDTALDFKSERAHQTATSSGVAIFSIAEQGQVPPDPAARSTTVRMNGGGGPRIPATRSMTIPGFTELGTVSERSGGMLLETDPRRLDATLSRFVTLVRGRYIVEFNRPPDMSGGRHTLTVGCGQPQDFIRAAGTSMPIADPTQLDPSVQHGPSSGRPPDPDQLAPDKPSNAGSER